VVYPDVHFFSPEGKSLTQIDTVLVHPDMEHASPALNRDGVMFYGKLIYSLNAIPGTILNGETQGKDKDISDFLVKLSYFKQNVLRPLECLLLVSGVVIDCQNNALTPTKLEKKLDHVLCFRKCMDCFAEIKDFVTSTETAEGKMHVVCLKCSALPANARLKKTRIKVKHPNLLKNLPLATLLAAGRIEIMNEVNPILKRTSSVLETAFEEVFSKRLKVVTEKNDKEKNEEKLRTDAALEEEKSRAQVKLDALQAEKDALQAKLDAILPR
jgi:hypothetical protein